MDLHTLFAAGGLFKSLDGRDSSVILNGHVFIPPNSPAAVKAIAANLGARIGLEVVGFDLPIVKIYQEVGQVCRPVNIFINCGPFYNADAEAALVFDNADEKIYVTLSGKNHTALAQKGLELYAQSAAAVPSPKAEGQPNHEIRKSADLADSLTVKGLMTDCDGDFIADDFAGKIILDDACTDEEAVHLAHIAAKIASQTTELVFPAALLASEAESITGPSIRLTAGNAIERLADGSLRIGKDACDYFVRSFPHFDTTQTTLLSDASAWVSNQLKKAAAQGERTVFEINEEHIYWEVDALLAWVKGEVLPNLKAGAAVKVTAAISETVEVRREIEGKIAQLLKNAGAADAKVHIISSFKQGQSYILETVVPQLEVVKDQIGQFIIGFKPFQKSADEPWDDVLGVSPNYGDYEQGTWFELPIRWLQELYPVDDMIAERLGIPREAIEFVKLDFDAPHTYEITVKTHAGEALLHTHYSIDTVEKPYLSDFPNLGLVHISQGFAQCELNGEVLRCTLQSDLEAFWKCYQGALSRCRQNILDQGRAKIECQPFFKRLEVEVFASEPNELLGVRQDIISSLDALHEDIYFSGLDYFRHFGNQAVGELFVEPGLILPLIHQRNGQPMSFRISCIEEPVSRRVFDFALQKIVVEENAPATLHYAVAQSELSAAELKRILEAAGPADFPINGTLCFHMGGDAIQVTITPQTCGAEPLDIEAALAHIEDHIIGYEEYIQYVNQLRVSPLCKIVKVATSLEQREVYAFEFTRDIPVDVVSQSKRVAFQPSLFINARHHANEVSGTNSAFRLIFNMLIDENLRRSLEAFNLVVIPLENVDGTALGYELQKEHPTWIFHPARYNSVGRDFYFDYFTDKEGECQGFTHIWNKWLPDFLTDDHGVPSHEWAQPFSGYVSPWFRGFWLPRSMMYFYCTYVNSPGYEFVKPYYEAVANCVSKAMDAHADIVEASLEWKDRHSKYAFNFMPNMYPQDYVGNWITYFKGVEQNPKAFYPQLRYPSITTFSWITEVADETAQGDYLALCSNTHYVANMAVIDYLSGCQHIVKTEAMEEPDGVRLRKRRARPIPIGQ